MVDVCVVRYSYIVIRVDFCIARFTEMGDAKAPERGTGNSTNSTLLFYMPNQCKTLPLREFGGTKVYCQNGTDKKKTNASLVYLEREWIGDVILLHEFLG